MRLKLCFSHQTIQRINRNIDSLKTSFPDVWTACLLFLTMLDPTFEKCGGGGGTAPGCFLPIYYSSTPTPGRYWEKIGYSLYQCK